MEQVIRPLLREIDDARLAYVTMALTRIPSPSGQADAIIEWYAQHLREMGLSPTVFTEIPGAPTLLAEIPGAGDGPTLTLLGHLDHQPLEHPPAYQDGGMIYGRGCADAKSGVAAITEVARVLTQSGVPLRGTVKLVVHTTHERVENCGVGLDRLAREGRLGSAVLVASGPHHYVPIAGRGCAQFLCRIQSLEESVADIFQPPEAPNPILESASVINRLMRWREELGRFSLPYLGPDTVHVGAIHAGDAPHRFPRTCTIAGIHRFGPEVTEYQVRDTFAHLERELKALLRSDVALEVTIQGIGYRIHEREPIVQMLRRAYSMVTERDLPLGGYLEVGEASKLAGEYGIPTVYHGTNRERHDADLEYVSLRDIVRAARVYLATAVLFARPATAE